MNSLYLDPHEFLRDDLVCKASCVFMWRLGEFGIPLPGRLVVIQYESLAHVGVLVLEFF